MPFRRLSQVLFVALATALPHVSIAANSADYPSRPIKLVVNFAAGGTSDVLARALARVMSDKLGQPVIVENKTGALGAIGAGEVSRAKNDGYTLLLTTQGALTEIPVISSATRYDPKTDLTPVSLVAEQPFVLFANAKFPANNIAELVEYAKTRPDGIDIAVTGSSVKLGTYALASAASINLVQIPYGGVGPAIAAALGDITPLGLNAATSAMLENVKAGQLKFLGVASPSPYSKLPGVPPISDTLPGYKAVIWWGVFAPGNTPEKIVNTLNSALRESLTDEQVVKVLDANVLTGRSSTPAELTSLIDEGLAATRQLVKENNIPVE